MQNIDLIIEKFQRGNAEQRLYLYLEYRELRSCFEQIENQENTKTLQLKIVKEETTSFASPHRRLIRWYCSLIS